MSIVKGNDESSEKRTQQPTSDIGESKGRRVEKDRVRRKQFPTFVPLRAHAHARRAPVIISRPRNSRNLLPYLMPSGLPYSRRRLLPCVQVAFGQIRSYYRRPQSAMESCPIGRANSRLRRDRVTVCQVRYAHRIEMLGAVENG